MAANTSRTARKSGDEFLTRISELYRCLRKIDRMMNELSKRSGGRTEDEMKKLNDAITFFNNNQTKVNDTLLGFELLGEYPDGSRMLQITELNSVFQELDDKVTELVPGETKLDKDRKKKGKMKQEGGESSSTNVPDDDDPMYLQNVQSIKREVDLLKEKMKSFTVSQRKTYRLLNQSKFMSCWNKLMSWLFCADHEEPPRRNF